MRRPIHGLVFLALVGFALLGAGRAAALDVEVVNLWWSIDRTEGVLDPSPNTYRMEIDVAGADIDSIEVVTPGTAGSFDLEYDSDDATWAIPLSVTQSFGSEAALFAAFPAGSYTFNIEGDGGATTDTIVRNFAPITPVTDFLAIVQPISSGPFLISSPVTFSDCTACDGNRIEGVIEDASTGDEVDSFTDTDLSRTTWSPSGLAEGGDYAMELILSDYLHYAAATTTDSEGDSFALTAGYSSINKVDFSVATAQDYSTTIGGGSGHSCALTPVGGVVCWGDNTYGQLGDGTTTNSATPVSVSGLSSGVVSIAVDGYHSCALTTAGAVLCWGRNSWGQIGDGTTTDRLVPTAVSGLSSGVIEISAGLGHNCALNTSGALVCWGQNWAGQVGDGTTTQRTAPTAVAGLGSGVVAVEASTSNHTCAVTTGGALFCWGYNHYGQLGDGTTSMRTTPTAVSGLGSGVVAVAPDGEHTCALTSAGAVSCWGRNDHGQLGDGTTTNRSTASGVSGLASGVAAISVGTARSCALTTSGAVLCWGWNNWGQIGDGTTTDRLTPTAVSGLSSGVDEIASGDHHSCARIDGDRIECWGWNDLGQLGDGSTTDSSVPVVVVGFEGYALPDTEIQFEGEAGLLLHRLGEDSSPWLTGGGIAKVGVSGGSFPGHLESLRLQEKRRGGIWGSQSLAFADQAVAPGYQHSCALTPGGGVACWGENNYGQLGDGTTVNHLTPAPVTGLANPVESLAAGAEFNCALESTGGVECWGRGLGIGYGSSANSSVPAATTGLSSGVAAITAAPWGHHACALTSVGAVLCWGYGANGRIGDGTNFTRYTPTPVTGLSTGMAAVSAGGSSTCALGSGGGVLCWGYNISGQVGDGTTTDRWTPTPVSGLAGGVASISMGGGHACALTTAGAVLCWGRNIEGQLGDGTNTDRLTPVAVSGLSSGVVAIRAGGANHTCAVTDAGAVLCWGENSNGALGNGTWASSNVPVAVSGLPSGVVALGLGTGQNCALTAEDELWCWGYNAYGQVGDGTTTNRNLPIQLTGEYGGSVGIAGASGLWSVALSNAEVGTATLAPISGGVASTSALELRELPLRGLLKLCLVDPTCTGGVLDFALTAPTSGTGAVGIGIGGTVSGTAQSFTGTTSPVQFTLTGAPWTLKTATVSDQTGVTGSGTSASPLLATATVQGFAHGPASATSSTADVNGVVQLVSPVQITTSLDPSDPLHLTVLGATARLRLQFVPEPAALLGLAAALAGLTALARRSRN